MNPPAVTISKLTDTFLDSIVNEKYGPGVDAEIRRKVKQDLAGCLDRWIALKTMTELAVESSKTVSEFHALTTRNAPAPEVQAFIGKHITNYTEFLSKILLEFKSVYIGQK